MSRTRTSRWGAVFTVALVSSLLVLTGCGTAATSSDLTRVKQDGVLTVGNDTTFAPFEFDDSANKPTGFDIDLITAVAQKLGLKTDIETTAWDGIILALQAQKFEVVISAMTITPDREKEVSFSIPYYRADMGIMYNPARSTITKPEDLKGKTVGVQTGTTGEIDAKLIAGVKVNSYPDIQLATLDLENGKIDAVVNDYPVCTTYANAHTELKVLDTTSMAGQDLTQVYGIAVRKDDAQLKNDIDAALRKVVADGTYASLYRKYFFADPPYLPK